LRFAPSLNAAAGADQEVARRLRELEGASTLCEREQAVQSRALNELRREFAHLRETVARVTATLDSQIRKAVQAAAASAVGQIQPRLAALEAPGGVGNLTPKCDDALSARVHVLEEAQAASERDRLGQRAELRCLVTLPQQVADLRCALDGEKGNMRASRQSFSSCQEDAPASERSNSDLHLCFSEFQWDCEGIVRGLAKRLEAEQLYRRGCDCLFGSNGYRCLKSQVMGISALLGAAEKGHADAQAMFARCCWEGTGCPQNPALFTRYSKMAADQGNSFGQAQYARALAHGIGVEADSELAMKLAIMSAGQENGMGYNQMGQLYELGIGTCAAAQDAFGCYQRAAALGNALGHYNCGLYLSTGRAGEQDKVRGLWHFAVAAEQGIPAAQFIYADALHVGDVLKKDSLRAARFMKKAADGQWPAAQWVFGEWLAKGMNVQKDVVTGKEYYQKAIDYYRVEGEKGNAKAQAEYQRLSKKFGSLFS
jgi:TPR repeat protein